ncbi:class I SAM-dependent methyltransferase [Mesorhizobium sp. M0621]|uniref:class I SAM-dependent methyltransferase n=1 Tax=Mesorhizobium sp. M0621 TaxID=2956974 RepID=UPI0033377DF3
MNDPNFDPRQPNGHSATRTDSRPYALGYSEGEFMRLQKQGEFFSDLTEDMMRRAGIEEGMRVLDIGCGVGDVSLIAGRLAGSSGKVLGIDRSADAVAIAQRRAAEAGQSNWMRFAIADIETFSPEGTFDAVIGRLVLMYLPDPAETLRRLCRHLRPGGVVAFQELVMPMARSNPDGPQFRQCIEWIMGTFDRAGFELEMGSKLFATFVAAGLPAPQMIASSRTEGGPHSLVYDYLSGVVRSLLPMTEQVGVATPAEIAIDTLAERLREEAIQHNACIMLPPFVGAWTTVPK